MVAHWKARSWQGDKKLTRCQNRPELSTNKWKKITYEIYVSEKMYVEEYHTFMHITCSGVPVIHVHVLITWLQLTCTLLMYDARNLRQQGCVGLHLYHSIIIRQCSYHTEYKICTITHENHNFFSSDETVLFVFRFADRQKIPEW